MYNIGKYIREFNFIDNSSMQLDQVIARIKSNNKTNIPAVVLGLDFNGLGIVRSLGKMNVPIIGVYTFEYEVGRHSRYCMPLRFPPLLNNLDDFKSKLLDLGKKLSKKSVLFSQNDAYVKFISDNRDELEKYFLFLMPEKELLDKVIDKRESTILAQKNGLVIPKTNVPVNKIEIDKISQYLKFPVIIKPFDSIAKNFPGRRKIVYNQSELSEFFNNHANCLGKSVVQEIVGNGDGNIFQCQTYFDKNFKPLALFTERKIRQYPTNFGVGTYLLSEINNDIIDLSVNFLKKINYKGPASLEFIFNEEENSYIFIELNPRYPGQLIFCTEDGVNLPYITYCDLINISFNSIISVQLQKTKFIWVDPDIRAYYQNWLNGQAPNFFKWIKTYFTANSFIYWDRKDIMPFLFRSIFYRAFVHFIRKLRSKLRK